MNFTDFHVKLKITRLRGIFFVEFVYVEGRGHTSGLEWVIFHRFSVESLVGWEVTTCSRVVWKDAWNQPRRFVGCKGNVAVDASLTVRLSSFELSLMGLRFQERRNSDASGAVGAGPRKLFVEGAPPARSWSRWRLPARPCGSLRPRPFLPHLGTFGGSP